MRFFAGIAAIGSLTLLCLSGPGLAQNEAKDLEKMQGIWIIESGTQGDKNISAETKSRLKFTIRGNQLIPSDNPKNFQTIKLDPAKNPAAIDLTDDSKLSLGIYRLEENTLKLCFVEGGDRPTSFLPMKENKAISLVLKRDKK